MFFEIKKATLLLTVIRQPTELHSYV